MFMATLAEGANLAIANLCLNLLNCHSYGILTRLTPSALMRMPDRNRLAERIGKCGPVMDFKDQMVDGALEQIDRVMPE